MAKKPEIIVGLDVGTTKICALIAESDDQGGIRIIGVGVHPSHGVRKGEIINVDDAIESIEKAVARAEQVCGIEVKSIFAGVTGAHIESFNSRALVPVARPTAGITEKDIARAIEAAQTFAIPQNRDVLHVIPQEFAVDERSGIINPKGMLGSRLEAQVHIVTGAVTAIQNIIKSINQAGLKVEDIVLQQLAASLAVLRKEEQKSGVVLINMGGGSTDYVLFRDEVIRHTNVISIGGDHVTNDISIGFNLLHSQAEEIKKEFGQAISVSVSDQARISAPPALGRPVTGLSRKKLCRIIELRMEELFKLIRADLEKRGLFQSIGTGLVLTGGGSLLKGIESLAQKITGLPTRMSTPWGITGLIEVIDSPIYATAVGLVKYGFQRRSSVEHPRLFRLTGFGTVFQSVKSWFNNYF